MAWRPEVRPRLLRLWICDTHQRRKLICRLCGSGQEGKALLRRVTEGTPAAHPPAAELRDRALAVRLCTPGGIGASTEPAEEIYIRDCCSPINYFSEGFSARQTGEGRSSGTSLSHMLMCVVQWGLRMTDVNHVMSM